MLAEAEAMLSEARETYEDDRDRSLASLSYAYTCFQKAGRLDRALQVAREFIENGAYDACLLGLYVADAIDEMRVVRGKLNARGDIELVRWADSLMQTYESLHRDA